jgi:hypothetical protein
VSHVAVPATLEMMDPSREFTLTGIVAVNVFRGASCGIAIDGTSKRVVVRCLLAKFAEVRLPAAAHVIAFGAANEAPLIGARFGSGGLLQKSTRN